MLLQLLKTNAALRNSLASANARAEFKTSRSSPHRESGDSDGVASSTPSGLRRSEGTDRSKSDALCHRRLSVLLER